MPDNELDGAADPAVSEPAPHASHWRQQIAQAARRAALEEERSAGGLSSGFLYRWEHVKAVVRVAIRLADLTGADRQVVEAAAWLHDISKDSEQNHGRSGAVAARRILATTDFPPAKIESVADAIAKHVGLFNTQPVRPLEAAVLWDADKLTKLGATAVLHFAGAEIARRQITTAEIVDRLPGTGWQQATVASLNTAPARAAGKERLQVFADFCQQAARELHGQDLLPPAEGGPDPALSRTLSPQQPRGGDAGSVDQERRKPT